MFENDVTLTGKHATYMKYFVNTAKLYRRYIDVYMNGAIFGLLHDHTAPVDKESSDRARIYADAFANCRVDCVFLYRLVMLLDPSKGLNISDKIDRAFRDDADEQESQKLAANLELFNAYVRGGIDEMYGQFIDGYGSSPEEYLERADEVMKQFKDSLMGEAPKINLESLI